MTVTNSFFKNRSKHINKERALIDLIVKFKKTGEITHKQNKHLQRLSKAIYLVYLYKRGAAQYDYQQFNDYFGFKTKSDIDSNDKLCIAIDNLTLAAWSEQKKIDNTLKPKKEQKK